MIFKEKKLMEDEKLKLQLVKDETLNKIKVEKNRLKSKLNSIMKN